MAETDEAITGIDPPPPTVISTTQADVDVDDDEVIFIEERQTSPPPLVTTTTTMMTTTTTTTAEATSTTSSDLIPSATSPTTATPTSTINDHSLQALPNLVEQLQMKDEPTVASTTTTDDDLSKQLVTQPAEQQQQTVRRISQQENYDPNYQPPPIPQEKQYETPAASLPNVDNENQLPQVDNVEPVLAELKPIVMPRASSAPLSDHNVLSGVEDQLMIQESHSSSAPPSIDDTEQQQQPPKEYQIITINSDDEDEEEVVYPPEASVGGQDPIADEEQQRQLYAQQYLGDEQVYGDENQMQYGDEQYYYQQEQLEGGEQMDGQAYQHQVGFDNEEIQYIELSSDDEESPDQPSTVPPPSAEDIPNQIPEPAEPNQQSFDDDTSNDGVLKERVNQLIENLDVSSNDERRSVSSATKAKNVDSRSSSSLRADDLIHQPSTSKTGNEEAVKKPKMRLYNPPPTNDKQRDRMNGMKYFDKSMLPDDDEEEDDDDDDDSNMMHEDFGSFSSDSDELDDEDFETEFAKQEEEESDSDRSRSPSPTRKVPSRMSDKQKKKKKKKRQRRIWGTVSQAAAVDHSGPRMVGCPACPNKLSPLTARSAKRGDSIYCADKCIKTHIREVVGVWKNIYKRYDKLHPTAGGLRKKRPEMQLALINRATERLHSRYVAQNELFDFLRQNPTFSVYKPTKTVDCEQFMITIKSQMKKNIPNEDGGKSSNKAKDYASGKSRRRSSDSPTTTAAADSKLYNKANKLRKSISYDESGKVSRKERANHQVKLKKKFQKLKQRRILSESASEDEEEDSSEEDSDSDSEQESSSDDDSQSSSRGSKRHKRKRELSESKKPKKRLSIEKSKQLKRSISNSSSSCRRMDVDEEDEESDRKRKRKDESRHSKRKEPTPATPEPGLFSNPDQPKLVMPSPPPLTVSTKPPPQQKKLIFFANHPEVATKSNPSKAEKIVAGPETTANRPESPQEQQQPPPPAVDPAEIEQKKEDAVRAGHRVKLQEIIEKRYQQLKPDEIDLSPPDGPAIPLNKIRLTLEQAKDFMIQIEEACYRAHWRPPIDGRAQQQNKYTRQLFDLRLNLNRENNVTFYREVLRCHYTPDELSQMETAQMASAAQRAQREAEQEENVSKFVKAAREAQLNKYVFKNKNQEVEVTPGGDSGEKLMEYEQMYHKQDVVVSEQTLPPSPKPNKSLTASQLERLQLDVDACRTPSPELPRPFKIPKLKKKPEAESQTTTADVQRPVAAPTITKPATPTIIAATTQTTSAKSVGSNSPPRFSPPILSPMPPKPSDVYKPPENKRLISNYQQFQSRLLSSAASATPTTPVEYSPDDMVPPPSAPLSTTNNVASSTSPPIAASKPASPKSTKLVADYPSSPSPPSTPVKPQSKSPPPPSRIQISLNKNRPQQIPTEAHAAFQESPESPPQSPVASSAAVNGVKAPATPYIPTPVRSQESSRHKKNDEAARKRPDDVSLDDLAAMIEANTPKISDQQERMRMEFKKPPPPPSQHGSSHQPLAGDGYRRYNSAPRGVPPPTTTIDPSRRRPDMFNIPSTSATAATSVPAQTQPAAPVAAAPAPTTSSAEIADMIKELNEMNTNVIRHSQQSQAKPQTSRLPPPQRPTYSAHVPPRRPQPVSHHNAEMEQWLKENIVRKLDPNEMIDQADFDELIHRAPPPQTHAPAYVASFRQIPSSSSGQPMRPSSSSSSSAYQQQKPPYSSQHSSYQQPYHQPQPTGPTQSSAFSTCNDNPLSLGYMPMMKGRYQPYGSYPSQSHYQSPYQQQPPPQQQHHHHPHPGGRGRGGVADNDPRISRRGVA